MNGPLDPGRAPHAWPALTLPQMLREQARRQPSAVAIRQKDFGIWKPLTWDQYWQRACRVGLGLRALGLSAGGRVAIVSDNRVEWLLTQMGACAAGGVAVGVYSTSPAEEMGYVLAHADVELVVCEDQEQTDKVLHVADRLPNLRRIVVIETKGLRAYGAADRARIVTFAEVEADGGQREAGRQGEEHRAGQAEPQPAVAREEPHHRHRRAIITWSMPDVRLTPSSATVTATSGRRWPDRCAP
mgnify:CR=1 FL=1